MSNNRDSGTVELISTLNDGVLALTLNRPEARNAMTDAMLDALQREISFAESSPDVRCIVLQGAGKAFCAGGDVKKMGDTTAVARDSNERIQRQRRVQRQIAGKLFKMPKPTMAVINGSAAGAGLGLALSCDLRVMGSSAIMLTAFASVGLSGDFGVTYFLSRLVGSAKARELMFLPDRLSAAEAVRLGLANWSFDPDELETQSRAIAKRLAAGPTIAFGYMKENLNRAVSAGVDECMDLEATYHAHCSETDDHREGVAAFLEKRAPQFGTRR